MKLQAKSSRELSKVLQRSARCISTKNAISILDHVLLTMHEDGQLFFVSSTGDSQLTTPAPLSVVDGKFDESIALPLLNIAPFLTTLPDCVITITFNVSLKTMQLNYCIGDNENLKTGQATMAYAPGKDFPLFNSLGEKLMHISVPKQLFEKTTSIADSFVSKDNLRPVLECLCVDIADDLSDVAFVATNGNMLYKRNLTNNPERGGFDFFRSGRSGKMLIHMRDFRSLSVFDECETIDIESDGRLIRFSSGDIELISRSIEGKYPNYKSVIPRDNPFFICFDKKEMLSVLKRVSLFSDKGHNRLVLEKKGLFLELSAKDYDFSLSAEDQVFIKDANCEENFRIGFEIQKLTNAIKALDGDTLRMQLIAPSRPAIITNNTSTPNSLSLCMPMAID